MSKQNSDNLFDRVYKVVRKIPKGKVATYGQIAEILGTKDARKVGWALHGNKDPKVPCHRVVNKQGCLAPNFGFHLAEGRFGWDGEKEQRRRLVNEGVVFKKDGSVDIKSCCVIPSIAWTEVI